MHGVTGVSFVSFLPADPAKGLLALKGKWLRIRSDWSLASNSPQLFLPKTNHLAHFIVTWRSHRSISTTIATIARSITFWNWNWNERNTNHFTGVLYTFWYLQTIFVHIHIRNRELFSLVRSLHNVQCNAMQCTWMLEVL